MLQFYMSMVDSPEDKHKVEQLYEKYKNIMYHVALNILGADHLAEDAMHQAFINIMNHLDMIGEVVCPQTRSYCVIICKRVAIDMKRREHKEKFIDFNDMQESVSGGSNIEDDVILKMELEILVDRILQLPDIYRDVFYLYYSNDFSVKQIAETLQITRENAKKRLQRARHLLLCDLQAGVIEK